MLFGLRLTKIAFWEKMRTPPTHNNIDLLSIPILQQEVCNKNFSNHLRIKNDYILDAEG